MTNFEKIKQGAVELVKQASVEDMAKVVYLLFKTNPCEYCGYAGNCSNADCENGIKLWLESEAEE